MEFTAESENEPDFKYLEHVGVTFFIRKKLLESAVSELSGLGYHVIRLHFDNHDQFDQLIADQFKWKEQFGYEPWNRSFDALNDGLRGEPFNTSDKSVICIEDYERLDAAYNSAWHFLDLIEHHSREYLLFGKRLVGLIQTNDSNFDPPEIGMRQPKWNRDEWLISSREGKAD